MDDLTSSPPARLALSRECEASRLAGQLLARAYQRLFPQVRRPIVDRTITSPVTHLHEDTSTAAHLAAGA